jgi:acyl carrier protein phosphodiesterase
MNFLAHIYLSGDDDQIKLGNFMGDYIKGNAYQIYPDKIQKGIRLHRNIDWFTDKNRTVIKAKELFYIQYHKYAGIVTDILYDHFLANNWNRFSDTPLYDYSQNFYSLLLKYEYMMPTDIQVFIPKLIENNRLYSYRTIEGIQSVLSTMATFTSLPDYSEFAILTLKENYSLLEENFFTFFAEIMYYVKNTHGIEIKINQA